VRSIFNRYDFCGAVKNPNSLIMKKLVYIIEDDVDILTMLATLLMKNGFEIHADWNGNDLESKTVQAPEPDVYMMDINLYGKNGLDLCRLIKQRQPNKPVVLLSANHNYTDKALGAGADLFIEKPFDLKNLIQQINRLTGGENIN